MSRYYCLFIVWSFFQTTFFAQTWVYFENNSSLSFSVSIQQFGTHTLSPGEWNPSASSITPWEAQKEIMWTNRNTGIHNGDDFFFDMHLISGSDSITLQLKLTGTFTASNMWISAQGPSFSHPWYGDNNFHDATFSLNGKVYTLKYHAYFTGGYDDIFFALQEEDPYPINFADTSDANTFNVLAYNIFMLTPPIGISDQDTRAAVIPDHIHGYDAIIFSEAFYNAARNTLQTGISAEYPYMTAVVDNGVLNDDGGVFIASRFPIMNSSQIVFSDCNGSDCLAAKGVMYAKINKLGKTYHLFGTHTQAWNTATDVATRILQFKEMDQFISSQNIPSTEAVIIGGDLNVDMIANNLGEYDGMLDSLNLLEPSYIGHPYTYDPDISYYASGSAYEFLDYVMTKNDYLTPTSATNEVLILRSIDDSMFNMFDLSDHLAVRGHFQFPVSTNIADLLPEEDISFTIQPNPATENVSIQFDRSTSGVLSIYDLLGNLLTEKKILNAMSSRLHLYSFEAGLYSIHFHEDGSKTNRVKKLIIY
jgi:endonuclease/exonuclease/phosphatase family metal-dependent hydrolase